MAGLHLNISGQRALQVGRVVLVRCDGKRWIAHIGGGAKADVVDAGAMQGKPEPRYISLAEIVPLVDGTLIVTPGFYWIEET